MNLPSAGESNMTTGLACSNRREIRNGRPDEKYWYKLSPYDSSLLSIMIMTVVERLLAVVGQTRAHRERERTEREREDEEGEEEKEKNAGQR